MDSLYNRLAYLGHLNLGHVPVLSPILDDFEMMKYIRPTLKPTENDFRVLIDMSLFEPKEIEIKISKTRFIEIRAKHGRRQDSNGLWMTRDCIYTYKIPEEAHKKELHALWSEDDYLLIQTTSSSFDDNEDEIPIVPVKVQRNLSSMIDVRQIENDVVALKNGVGGTENVISFDGYKNVSEKTHTAPLTSGDTPHLREDAPQSSSKTS